MVMNFGLGPVFTYDWLTTSRRWQVYAARSLFVAALLVNLSVVWTAAVSGRDLSIRAQAKVGQDFFIAIVGTQLALVLLAAPAATADAICLDKARGTLAHLLVTDLSDAEIVLGKLAARLAPTLGIVACGLPVVAVGTLLGGIDPASLLAAFLVTSGSAVLGCAIALAFSVWAVKTHEVLLATYAVFTVWILAYPLWMGVRLLGAGWTSLPPPPEWFARCNPFWLTLGQYAPPALFPTAPSEPAGLADHVAYLAGCSLLSAILVALVVWRVRAVAVRQADRPSRARRGPWSRLAPSRWTRLRLGPSLDGNPVLWREWHRRKPAWWARAVWTLYAVLTGAFSLGVIAHNLLAMRPRISGPFPPVFNAFQVAVGLMLLSVTSATALAEERAHNSLEILLSTPLSTRAIVWGKWWGTFRAVPLLAVWPGLVACALAWRNPTQWPAAVLVVAQVVAQGAAITSLGLALATWVSRVGRAVPLTVTAYVLVTAGWVFLVFVLFRDNKVLIPGLAMASPFFGALFPTVALALPGGFPAGQQVLAWATFWAIAYALAAAILLQATIATFDRCLGRMPADPRPVRGSGSRTL
jgi:ABC-type transport system involved in multi-copper enzyme maturation permease subunit